MIRNRNRDLKKKVLTACQHSEKYVDIKIAKKIFINKENLWYVHSEKEQDTKLSLFSDEMYGSKCV